MTPYEFSCLMKEWQRANDDVTEMAGAICATTYNVAPTRKRGSRALKARDFFRARSQRFDDENEDAIASNGEPKRKRLWIADLAKLYGKS